MSNTSDMQKVIALVARTESASIEEARTSALLAIKLLKRLHFLPTNCSALIGKIQEVTRKRRPKIQHFSSKGGKAGGKARAAALTPERRSEIAKKAVATRWRNKRKALKAANTLLAELD